MRYYSPDIAVSNPLPTSPLPEITLNNDPANLPFHVAFLVKNTAIARSILRSNPGYAGYDLIASALPVGSAEHRPRPPFLPTLPSFHISFHY